MATLIVTGVITGACAIMMVIGYKDEVSNIGKAAQSGSGWNDKDVVPLFYTLKLLQTYYIRG